MNVIGRYSSALLGALALLSLSIGVAQASPITYIMNIKQATGTLNGVPFGPGATVLFTVHADTNNIVSTVVAPLTPPYGGPGHCVPASQATVSVNGGSAQAISNANFCATTTGVYAAITPVVSNPTLNDFTVAMDVSNTVSGFPGGTWNLVTPSNFGPVTYVADHIIASPAATLNLVGGGVLQLNTLSGSGGSTLQVVSPITVPTLSVLGLGLLVLLMIGLAWFGLRRMHRTRMA